MASRWGFPPSKPNPPHGFPVKKGLQFTDGTFQACLGSSQLQGSAGQGIPKGDILGPFWLEEETKKPKNQRDWAQMNSVTSNYFWMLHMVFGGIFNQKLNCENFAGGKKSRSGDFAVLRAEKNPNQKIIYQKITLAYFGFLTRHSLFGWNFIISAFGSQIWLSWDPPKTKPAIL